MQAELGSQPCEELHMQQPLSCNHTHIHAHTCSRGVPCKDGEQLPSVSDGGCAWKWRRRRRVAGGNVGQSFCLNCFSAEKAKRDESKQNTNSPRHTASRPPLLSIQHYSSSFNCFGYFSSSHQTLSLSRQDNGSVLYAHSPALATVAWIQHVKNHINISPEEGVSASNGTGLRGKEDTGCRGARGWSGTEVVHNWGGRFWKHPAEEESEKRNDQHCWDYLLALLCINLGQNTKSSIEASQAVP